jgi:hypothetical protein
MLGNTGMFFEAYEPEDALQAGQSGILILPFDVAKYRSNIGVRTLSGGATLGIALKDKNGVTRQTTTKTYPSDFFTQVRIEDFIGSTVANDDVVVVTVNSGSAFVYLATTNNATEDAAFQLARPVN